MQRISSTIAQAAAPGSTIGFELFELSGTDKVSLKNVSNKPLKSHKLN